MSSKTRPFENAAGTLEIQKHSCDIHFCNKDCTCAILGQPCKSNINCSQQSTNPVTQGLPLVHVYGGLPDKINHISASSACIAAHWVTDGDEALVERYEWTMGLTGQPVGDGIFDLKSEIPWKDVGKRKEAVYCIPSHSGLQHNTNYSVYVKAWYSFDLLAEFVSGPIFIDHRPPQRRKGKYIKDSDLSCIMDYDIIDWMDTTTACWDGVFLESQGKIIHYSLSLGTTINGSDVYSRTNVGLTTNITLTSLSLSHGTRYYFTVTAYNDVGMHSSISSDGFVIDMDRPVAGVVLNTDMHTDTLYQASNTSFSTSWHGFVDPFSGIKTFYVAVIDSSVTDYTNVTYTNVNLQTMHTFKNLKLEHGRSYVALVKAVDAAGHESDVVRSSQKAIDVTPPSPFECLHYDNINSTYNGQFAAVSFNVNLMKNVMYVIRGIITGNDVEDVSPILTIGRYKHLPVAVNHNGTVEFEYALLSPFSGPSTINISTHEQWRTMSNYSANIKVGMYQCTQRRPVSDQTKALVVQQVGASRLGISCFVSDEESALYKIQIGAGTTPGGFQIKALSDIRGRTSKIIDINVEHGSQVYVSAIAYNHARLRSIFHALPVIIDKTPPAVRIIETKVTWADSRSNDTEGRTTVTSRLSVTDGESGIKYCICSLGRKQGSADVMSSAVSDSIESCLFENLTLRHGESLYTTVKCINNVELATETTSDRIIVSMDHPDTSKAAIRVIPSDKMDIAISNSVQTGPYVLTDGSHFQLEWSGFHDISGIEHYEYRLMAGNQSLTDWTSAGKHTSADIKGVNLAFGKFFTAEVRAVNLGMYKSSPVSVGVVFYNKEPALTGKPVSMTRRENMIEIDWSGVFRLTNGLEATFNVLVGTHLGYADVIELQKIYDTRYIINLPRSTIITPNVSELFITITCTYNTGLYTVYRTSYNLI